MKKMFSEIIRAILLLFGVSSTVVGATVLSPIILGITDNFCNRNEHSLRCDFKTTNQPVILGDVQAGILNVNIVSAKTFRGLSSCGTNVEVWSSSNVTLLGSNAKEDINTISSTPSSSFRLSRQDGKSLETVNPDFHEISFPTDVRRSSSGYDPTTENGHRCHRNITVNQSRVRLLQGGFDTVNLKSSGVENIDGLYHSLFIRQQCDVKMFSASANSLVIQETNITEVLEMKVAHSMHIDRTTVTIVREPGIVLSKVTDGSSKVEPSYNNMTNLSIKSLKPGKIVVNGSHLVMNSVSIGEIGGGAISIENGGSVILNNVNIGRGPDFCLVLRGSASIILRNFILRGKVIDHLNISIIDAALPVYPLQALPDKKTGVRISPHQNSSLNKKSESDSEGFINLDWYWVPIMTAVGLVSGMVIACAVRCSRSERRPNEMLSSLSFSELVARERHCGPEGMGEGVSPTVENGYVGPQHPDLVRQDSGLTSSSFASYTACADRRHSSKQLDDFDRVLSSHSDSSVFIHVPPIACTRESVIYEEVETLPPKKENIYLAMK